MNQAGKARRFTLIELLIVITIIATVALWFADLTNLLSGVILFSEVPQIIFSLQPVRFHTCKLIAISYTPQAETANVSYLSYHLLFLVVNVLSCKTLQYTTKRRRFQEKDIRKTLKINNLNNLAERISLKTMEV